MIMDKKFLPIGNSNFRNIRKNNQFYYIDKSLFIKEFMEHRDKASLITRPRRFGKTLNMTMLREFFDITKESHAIFEGLEIMNTEYASYMNSHPVIFFSFKDCRGNTIDELRLALVEELLDEYCRFSTILGNEIDKNDLYYFNFYNKLSKLKKEEVSFSDISSSLKALIKAVYYYYKISPILLIDEYDQPILSSYENNYHKDLNQFFSIFYGSALKDNEYLERALLTGIQRVSKESIFSQLNNVTVYTVLDEIYAPYFGLCEQETRELLHYYELELNEDVKNFYDGYLFGSTHIYNPWSILNYANKKVLDPYWINTSTNYLIKESLRAADDMFLEKYNTLIEKGSVLAAVKLETSYIECMDEYTLWGLLVNSGYLTIAEPPEEDRLLLKLTIPNKEVLSEFQTIVAEQANISASDLAYMFKYLQKQDMEHFLKIYQSIVTSCTSYYDAKENAYHMLFLGMCISLGNLYKVTSNLESGYGRHDICLESLKKGNMHIVIEFKQGEDIEQLKNEALQQIIQQKYYAGLKGKILCIGIAHDKKKCALVHKIVTSDK
jgi:hypothetical protein